MEILSEYWILNLNGLDKMNKNDIILTLEKYNFNKNEFIILSGASLVLQGLKTNTHDIDIATSDELYRYLLENYKCDFELSIDGYDIWFIDNVINFSNHFYNEVDYFEFDGYKIQTNESAEKIKKKMYSIKNKSSC